MKNKLFNAGLNLIVPGLGQLSAKRYVRGTIQALSAIGAVLWFIWEAAAPLIEFCEKDIINDKLPQMNFVHLIKPALLFFVVLAWSMIDILSGDKKTEENK